MILKRSGFTLIELLVVLAIVSILAGLTFPVFQAARSSALRSSCATNFRQVSLAAIMYTADYDDRFMIVNHQPSGSADSRTDRTWVQLSLPYVRSFSVFRCPEDHSPRPRPETTFDQDLVPGDTYSQYYSASMRANVGYNFEYLAPVVKIQGRWVAQPRSTQAVEDPSRTLMFVDSVWARSDSGSPVGGGSWLVVPPCRFILDPRMGTKRDTFTDSVGSEPEVYTPHQGWRPGDQNSAFEFGGAWPWHGDRMNLARADGSVGNLTAPQLSRGCDVRPEWGGTIQDSRDYIWDVR